jgi:hypothetical protein
VRFSLETLRLVHYALNAPRFLENIIRSTQVQAFKCCDDILQWLRTLKYILHPRQYVGYVGTWIPCLQRSFSRCLIWARRPRFFSSSWSWQLESRSGTGSTALWQEGGEETISTWYTEGALRELHCQLAVYSHNFTGKGNSLSSMSAGLTFNSLGALNLPPWALDTALWHTLLIARWLLVWGLEYYDPGSSQACFDLQNCIRTPHGSICFSAENSS